MKKTKAKTKRVRTASPGISRMVNRALVLIEEINHNKRLYGELDKLTEILKDHDLTGYPIHVVDNFTDKNNQWKSVAFRRFELSLEPPVETRKSPTHASSFSSWSFPVRARK